MQNDQERVSLKTQDAIHLTKTSSQRTNKTYVKKKIISQNFSRAAKNYEQHATVQNQAAEELTKIISPLLKNYLMPKSCIQTAQKVIKNNHQNKDYEGLLTTNLTVLDLGSGTGFLTKKLDLSVNNSRIYELDLAFEMLKENKNQSFKIQADIENLPFRDNSFDLVISSFSLQWVSNFNKIFSNIFSLLKTGGIFAFCLPNNDSLKEIKSANIFDFNDFPCPEKTRLELKNCGFDEIFFTTKKITQEFASGLEALQSIKKIGANYSPQKKVLNKSRLKEFKSFCLKNSDKKNRNFAVSWSISYFVTKKS